MLAMGAARVCCLSIGRVGPGYEKEKHQDVRHPGRLGLIRQVVDLKELTFS